MFFLAKIPANVRRGGTAGRATPSQAFVLLVALGASTPEATPSATLDIVFGNIAINVSRWTTIIATSVTLVIYTNLIAWFELWRGRRVSRRMARCLARLYAL